TFIGTTNRESYLRDETGGRRVLPVKCGEIDVNQIKMDRGQLLAEAVAPYRKGVQRGPGRDFEQQNIISQQEKRDETGPWEEKIAEYLTLKITTDGPGAKVTVSEVARVALLFETPRIGTADQRRIAAVMTNLGWNRQPKDWQGKRWWALRPSGASHTPGSG